MNPSLRHAALLSFAVFGAASAFAHSRLEVSEPVDGAQLSASPAELTFRFNEPVEAAVSSVKLVGPGDRPVVVEKAHGDPADARRIVVAVPKLGAGDYRAQWATAGHDGHRVKGEIRFSVR